MECKDAYQCLCAYLDGELDSGKVASVKQHLMSCLACRRELEAQRAVKYLVQEQFLTVTAPDYLKRRVIVELEKADDYRESGVQVLDLIRWGTHVAQLYKTKNELAEVLVPYVERGLEENELCVWVTSEMSQEEARVALTGGTQHLQEYIDKRQLQLLPYGDWYLQGGYFDIQRVLDSCLKKYQEALSDGYSGLRITGDASWVERSDWSSLMEYEEIINRFVPDYKILAICTYKETEWITDNISDVMNTHRYVISKMGNSQWLRTSAQVQ